MGRNHPPRHWADHEPRAIPSPGQGGTTTHPRIARCRAVRIPWRDSKLPCERGCRPSEISCRRSIRIGGTDADGTAMGWRRYVGASVMPPSRQQYGRGCRRSDLEWRMTRHQVARGSRPDAETSDKLFLIKQVSELRATYQIRVLAYRASQERRTLVIVLPKQSKVHSDLSTFMQSHTNIVVTRT